jgi:hypothetical protein
MAYAPAACAVAGLLQLPLQLIAIHRLDGDFTGKRAIHEWASDRLGSALLCSHVQAQ